MQENENNSIVNINIKEEKKEYVYALDNIKGIMILLVVFGHFLLSSASKGYGLTYDLYRIIYAFHMPVFMFVSGLLTHNTTSDWLKKIGTIYIIFNSLYYIIGVTYCKENLFFLNPAYSIWYILLLIAFRMIVKYIPNKRILLSLSFLAYILLPLCNVGQFFVHIKFGAFFIYFTLGYVFQEKFNTEFFNSLLKEKKTRIVASFICFVSILAMWKMISFWSISPALLNHASPFNTFSNNVSNVTFQSVCFLIMNVVFIFSILYAVPNKKIFELTTFGKNSLYIYLLHRVFPMIVPKYYGKNEEAVVLLSSLYFSLLICFVFGSDFFFKWLQNLKSFLKRITIKETKTIVSFILILSMLFCASSSQNTSIVVNKGTFPEIKQSVLDNCVKFSYIGDTLLFEEDIVRTKKDESNKLNFDSLFKDTQNYLGDYTFGVFEGVLDESSFSTGNFYDNRSLHLKYPIELAKDMSRYIDFATLGMNHLMDGGIQDVKYTISSFKNTGLNYTGAYLSQEDNDEVKIINTNGMSIAVLSYSDLMNYTDELEPYTYNSFDYNSILEDIEKAKRANVDLIVAMTHIGTQFNHGVDDKQKYWNNMLANNGVDVILSDHPHVVEPIEYIKNTLVFNCPGNYYTSLTGGDQEYGAICNFYVDKSSRRVVTASIVPIKSIVTLEGGRVSTLYDLNDINGTNLVLSNMIGIQTYSLSPEYFYSKQGYTNYYDDTLKNNEYFGNKKVCFIGDSITEGTMNNGHGWYEYLTENYTDVSVGGATTDTIIGLLKKNIPVADTYIIAIGCNDIRYENKDPDTFLSNIDTIVNMLPSDSEIYLVSPMYTLVADSVSSISYNDRNDVVEKYNDLLQSYSDEHGYVFVDMYSNLKLFFETCENDRMYMVDGVHPNCTSGIKLYSDIFIQSTEK